MHHARIARVLILATSFLLAACEHYRGNGILTDAGVGTAGFRYVVDLGAVSLSNPNRRSFKMVGLPATEFTIGLRPVNVSTGCDASSLYSTRVRLNIQADDGSVVVAEEGPLSTWITSSNLVYKRGTEREEPKAGGVFELIRSGVRASGGWGTYFTPQTSVTYVAKFDVLETHGTTGCDSHLILLGGGWK